MFRRPGNNNLPDDNGPVPGTPGAGLASIPAQPCSMALVNTEHG